VVRLEAVADLAYRAHRRHPWLAEAIGLRPGLGPHGHAYALYEWQLEAVQPLGVDDIDWWITVAPVLGELTEEATYPLAHRV
jgi:hypothetical protein